MTDLHPHEIRHTAMRDDHPTLVLDSLSGSMNALLGAATVAIAQIEHAGVLVSQRAAPVTAAVSGTFPASLQRLAISLEQGPGYEAISTGLTVVSEDVDHDNRWPAYAAAAGDLGLRSELAVPLIWEERTLGALGLYWTTRNVLDLETLTLAQAFAQQTAATIGLAFKAAQLEYAMATREMIGQATGMLMERYGMCPQSAFNFLRRNSQNTNTKLREIAEEFLRTGTLPELPVHPVRGPIDGAVAG